ncbi:MAG: hypothetical protein NTV32_08410 [Gammaproteobacteria bacterium]|nr:hypothetical protein [Gammaproteobacteria bacterium]
MFDLKKHVDQMYQAVYDNVKKMHEKKSGRALVESLYDKLNQDLIGALDDFLWDARRTNQDYAIILRGLKNFEKKVLGKYKKETQITAIILKQTDEASFRWLRNEMNPFRPPVPEPAHSGFLSRLFTRGRKTSRQSPVEMTDLAKARSLLRADFLPPSAPVAAAAAVAAVAPLLIGEAKVGPRVSDASSVGSVRSRSSALLRGALPAIPTPDAFSGAYAGAGVGVGTELLRVVAPMFNPSASVAGLAASPESEETALEKEKERTQLLVERATGRLTSPRRVRTTFRPGMSPPHPILESSVSSSWEKIQWASSNLLFPEGDATLSGKVLYIAPNFDAASQSFFCRVSDPTLGLVHMDNVSLGSPAPTDVVAHQAYFENPIHLAFISERVSLELLAEKKKRIEAEKQYLYIDWDSDDPPPLQQKRGRGTVLWRSRPSAVPQSAPTPSVQPIPSALPPSSEAGVLAGSRCSSIVSTSSVRVPVSPAGFSAPGNGEGAGPGWDREYAYRELDQSAVVARGDVFLSLKDHPTYMAATAAKRAISSDRSQRRASASTVGPVPPLTPPPLEAQRLAESRRSSHASVGDTPDRVPAFPASFNSISIAKFRRSLPAASSRVAVTVNALVCGGVPYNSPANYSGVPVSPAHHAFLAQSLIFLPDSAAVVTAARQPLQSLPPTVPKTAPLQAIPEKERRKSEAAAPKEERGSWFSRGSPGSRPKNSAEAQTRVPSSPQIPTPSVAPAPGVGLSEVLARSVPLDPAPLKTRSRSQSSLPVVPTPATSTPVTPDSLLALTERSGLASPQGAAKASPGLLTGFFKRLKPSPATVDVVNPLDSLPASQKGNAVRQNKALAKYLSQHKRHQPPTSVLVSAPADSRPTSVLLWGEGAAKAKEVTVSVPVSAPPPISSAWANPSLVMPEPNPVLARTASGRIPVVDVNNPFTALQFGGSATEIARALVILQCEAVVQKPLSFAPDTSGSVSFKPMHVRSLSST